MTPATNSSSISAQQHPRQNSPCLMPITSAPPVPSRHSVPRKPSGERQWPRQADFAGSH